MKITSIRSMGAGLATLALLAVSACGGDTPDDDADSESSATESPDAGDQGTEGENMEEPAPVASEPPPCSVEVAPGGDDDTESVQTALIEASTGEVICFGDGDYSFTRELSLTVPGVTLRGNPEDREAVVLDFAAQVDGDDALKVTSNDFTVEHLSIKNTKGNSIIVQGAENVIFRNLKVSWDAGPSMDNGAYAVYPIKSTNVLVEDSEVTGASDAGIYVGQCNNVIVRNNVVYQNVAGIEIENTNDAEVVGNTTYDNTSGILVFNLPYKEQMEGFRTLVHDNVIYGNNRSSKDFAEPGTTVALLPPGMGVLLLAADDTEVRDNVIYDNGSGGVVQVDMTTLDLICGLGGGSNCGPADDGTDPHSSGTYVHDNTWLDADGNGPNGTEPQGDAALPLVLGEQGANVVWDGRYDADDTDLGDPLCLGESPTSVAMFGQDNSPFLNADNNLFDDEAIAAGKLDCVGNSQDTVTLPHVN